MLLLQKRISAGCLKAASEYEKLLDAMQKHEGWKRGKEEIIIMKRVLGVHLDRKGVIFEFLIGDDSSTEWVPKRVAISLAEEGRLHAVVVHTESGTYLRPEPNKPPFREIPRHLYPRR